MTGNKNLPYRIFRLPSEVGKGIASIFKAIKPLRALFKGGGLEIHTQAPITSGVRAKEDIRLSARTLLQADGDLICFFTEEKSKDPDFIQFHFNVVAARIEDLNRMLTAIFYLPLFVTGCAVAAHYLWPLFFIQWKGFSSLWEILYPRLKDFGLNYLLFSTCAFLLGNFFLPLALRGMVYFFKMKFPKSALPEKSNEPMKLF